MLDFKNKNVVILGAARSGLACAKLLAKKGASVILNDADHKQLKGAELKQLKKLKVKTVTGGHPVSLLKRCDFIVISPGVRSDLELVKKAQVKKIPVLSEIEAAFQFIKCPVVAITGTNGKTTTTSLVGEIFQNAGYRTFVCGNIGLPMSHIVDKTDADSIVVAEISNFQLENILNFKPVISLMLNITPDHLDRYPSFSAYRQAKINIFKNQTSADFAVINYDDRESRRAASKIKPKVIFFSRKKILERGVFVEDGVIYYRHKGVKKKIIATDQLNITGPHNLENALAAVSCAQIYGLNPQSLRRTLSTFKGVEHRLELVRTINGIKFINDSKATNVDSVVKALESFKGKIILLAGGRDKGSPYLPLAKLVRQKVKALIVIGEAKDKIKKELGHLTQTYEVGSMLEAVKQGFSLACKGDIVLLSPACASFDMFRNYEQRGQIFKQIVRKLKVL